MTSYRESLNERETAAAGEVLFQNISDLIALFENYREIYGLSSIWNLPFTPIIPTKRSIFYCLEPEVHEYYYVQELDPFPLSTIGRYVEFHRNFSDPDKYDNKPLLHTDISVGFLDQNENKLRNNQLRIRHDYAQQVVNLTSAGKMITTNQYTVKSVNNIIESILWKEMSRSFRRIGKHYKNRLS